MGEETAGVRELDAHGVVVLKSRVPAEVGVADADEAEHEDGDDQEGHVLEARGGGEHQRLPSAGVAGSVVAGLQVGPS